MRKVKVNNFLVGLLVLFMLLGISWIVAAEEVIKIDLNSAVDMALKSDLDYKIATINYEKSKLEYEKKKANYLLQQSRYNELEMKMSLKSAENTYQNTRDQLVNDIISQYSNLWLASLDLSIKEKNLKLEDLRLKEAKAQYEIGDIGSIDLLEQENSHKDAQISLENTRDDYQQDKKEFITILRLDNKELQLSDLEYSDSWQVTEEEAVKTALKNSINLSLRADQLELAEIDLERARVSAAELDIKIKEKSVEAARLEKEKAREELNNSTQSAYYQFKQAVKKTGLNKERLISAEERYKVIKEQYKIGLITSIEVLEYEINMHQAKYNYLSSIADYYLKEHALRQAMGLKSGVLADETPAK